MFGYSVTAVAAGDARNDGYCDAADYDDDSTMPMKLIVRSRIYGVISLL